MVLVWGGRELYAGASRGLQFSLGWQVICVSLLLSDSSHCDFIVKDSLCVRLGFIRGLTILSRHHSPSLSIVDEFN